MSALTQAMRMTSRTGTVFGGALVILGILAILAPSVSGLAVITVIAVLLIVAGISQTVFAFRSPSFAKGVFQFLFGGVAVLFGAIMLARPLIGLASMALVLAAFFLFEGIVVAIAAFRLKPAEGWQWMLFGGLVSLLLAFMIWAQWPLSGAWAIGVLLGVWMILAGWSMITFGTSAGDVVHELQDSRLDEVEKQLRQLTETVQKNQADLAAGRIELMKLEAQVEKKVSVSDIDLTIVELNQKLVEARKRMQEASKSAQDNWAAVQVGVREAFETLRASIDEASEGTKGES